MDQAFPRPTEFPASRRGKHTCTVEAVAKRSFIATLTAGAVVVGALALWELKLILALIFMAMIIAAAMRPGVDWLRRHSVPRGVGVLIHYFALIALVGLFLYLVVPRATNQVRDAIKNLPTAKQHSHGIKRDILVWIDKRLKDLPSGGKLFHLGTEVGKRAFEIVIGIFFTLAVAAYWIFERKRLERVILSVLPTRNRRVFRDTWELIDLKLGAFVRGQLILILLVGTVLSLLFWIVGLPYWLLAGSFAGVVEIIPVIGPLVAGAVAIGLGITASWHVALAAGLCVLGVRLLEDYVIIPKVLGEAVGLSPLIVLISVVVVEILFGGFAVLLAVPFAAVITTLVDVVVLNKNPADEEVPSVIFSPGEAET
jgi:predicted PurR-regulated permease PerM